MDVAIGNLDNNDLGVFIGVVHPACVGLGKDDFVWLWHMAY